MNQNYTNNKNNGLAIAGLICSACGFITCGLSSIVGLILSIISFNKSKKENDSSKGLSIAGIILGSIFLLIYLLMFGLLILGINSSIVESYEEEEPSVNYYESEKKEETTSKEKENVTNENNTTKKEDINTTKNKIFVNHGGRVCLPFAERVCSEELQ